MLFHLCWHPYCNNVSLSQDHLSLINQGWPLLPRQSLSKRTLTKSLFQPKPHASPVGFLLSSNSQNNWSKFQKTFLESRMMVLSQELGIKPPLPFLCLILYSSFLIHPFSSASFLILYSPFSLTRNPISRRGSSSFIASICFSASKTTRKFLSYFCSILSIFSRNSLCVKSISRIRVNTRTI